MKKLIIIGNSEHAYTMFHYIEMTHFGEVEGFCVNEKYISDKLFCGKPVIALEKLESVYDPNEVSLIMGIGYTKMGDIKEKIYLECKEMGFSFENYIHPTAILCEDIQIGEGNNILEGVILESGVEMGDCNLIFGGAMIAHDTKVGSFNSFSVKSTVAGYSDVRNHCFIGANSTVRDHVVIADYSLIGAAAYADHDMNEYEVLVPQKSVTLEGKKSTDFL